MPRTSRILLTLALLGIIVPLTAAQYGGDRPRRGGTGSGDFGGGYGRGGGFGGGGWGRGGEYLRGNEPLEPLPEDRAGIAHWPPDKNFPSDHFTFVRLRFTTVHTGGRRGTATSWKNDWPHSDLNFSFRLQQLTSLKVNPDPVAMEITDPRLFDYPFAYMIMVGQLQFSDEEVAILRHWLTNGGFLMVDDFWGADQERWHEQLRRIFPDRQPVELGLSHPIFHCVFDLKEIPQVPAIQRWGQWVAAGYPERTYYDELDPDPHFRAIYDDKGRMMVLECGNNAIGEGWEREGENIEFFHRFSEKWAYPMGINIVFYAMTH